MAAGAAQDIHLRLFIPTFLYFNGPKMLEK